MLVFLVFHGSYALVHFYLYMKLKGILHLDGLSAVTIGASLLILAFSPMPIYLCSLRGKGFWARAVTFTGYMWMGFLILFFFPSVFMDIYNGFILLVERVSDASLDGMIISPSMSFLISLALSVSLTSYGYIRAKIPDTKRISLKTDKLPEGVKGLKIVHLTDVHLGVLRSDGLLDRVVRVIEEEDPDIIVSTGDLIDGGIENIKHLRDKLRSMDAPAGKFAIIGNHEFYTGINKAQSFLEECGFVVLRNEARTVNDIINIAGIDDAEIYSSKKDDHPYKKSERQILSELPHNRFTLLLKHKPEVDDGSLGLFDLQLSGHTHNGQIFPINIIVRLFFYPHSSYNRLPKGSAIYVSGGVGTAGPPVRLLSPPEIAVIEMERDGPKSSTSKE